MRRWRAIAWHPADVHYAQPGDGDARALHAIAEYTGARRLIDARTVGPAFAPPVCLEPWIARHHRFARREGLDLHSHHPTGGGADLRCWR
jgi:hypothetical protein